MMPDPSPDSPDQVEDYAQGDFRTPASNAQQNLQFVVKNRSSSGCLVVRKKGSDGAGGLGSSSSRNAFGSKKQKKRARMNMSDSGSSDELLMPPRRRVAPETIRVCNVLSHLDSGGADGNGIGRKRIRNNEVDAIGRDREDFSERKRNRLDVFEFDEYDGSDEEMRRKPFDDEMEGRRYFSPMTVGRSGLHREYETGSSRRPVVDRRSSLYLEKRGVNRGDHGGSDRTRSPRPFYGDKYDSDGHIRVQGKNGVLKVMKKKVSGSLKTRDSLEVEEKRKGLRSEDTVKRTDHPLSYTEPKFSEKAGSSASKPKILKKLKSSSKRLSLRNGTSKDQDSDDSETSLKLGPPCVEKRSTRKEPLTTRSSKRQESESEDSDTSLKLGLKNSKARKLTKHASSSGEIVQRNELTPGKSKEGKAKRGTGTEKQKLREQIREMLLSKGWTIDYRPRRNRDYLDAVYISPSGTAYWSIIKAYDALLKQSKDEEERAKAHGDDSFRPLPDEALSQLTRNTRKKMEKEMKKKQKSKNARKTAARSSSSRHDEESMDSDSYEEKLSSFLKQSGSGKSVKSGLKGKSSIDRPHSAMEPSGVDSRHGRKSRKLGRCTLLVRDSNEGLKSDSDGYVPYSGKRTILSWLIDCGAVQLSQKVRYMNRRRTRVMLEGWATRDGIHCGCCSKILTILKFEIHAGSKQRQPFQNIYLDSGVSLLECQTDAWNRQESADLIGFHSVDVDGDDPNDDTCGICGDGGDLICCDNCPSTFHQSCLDIEMLPPGDWHCPHCSCNFCGLASEDITKGDEATTCPLLTCSLCAKKYHKSCSQGVDTLSNDSDSSNPCFCGKTCKEVFEQLQKYLGAKHELESGFSWCLIRRTDVNLDIYPQGHPQRVECNSKLAVALSVLDECFLPIVDRRSGINLLHNVLYNCGSNFSRLSYSGFYTAILERGDEIVSAASIRLHGTRFAEMPFIGTRHMYRRQGMCRRLFSAIESALCSMKVHKMIIPAISELTHTWTGVFGFSNVDTTFKQELKSINMLVFPGIDLLQKQLSGQDEKGVTEKESKDNQCSTPEAAVRPDINSSPEDINECDDGDCNGEISTRNIDSLDSPDENKKSAPLETVNTGFDPAENKSRSTAEKLDDIPESSSPTENHSLLAPLEETVNTDSDHTESKNPCIAEKMDFVSESTLPAENRCGPLDSSNGNLNPEEAVNSDFDSVEIKSPCVAEKMGNNHDNSDFSIQGDVPTPRESGVSIDDTLVMSGSFDSCHEKKNIVSIDLTSDCKSIISADSGGSRQEEKRQEAISISPAIEGGIEDVHELNLNESASDELKMPKSIEDAKPVDDEVTADVEFQDSAPSTTDVDSKPVDDEVTADVAFQDSAPSMTDVDSKLVVDEVTADVAFQGPAPSMTDVDSKPVVDEVTADMAFQDSAPSTTDVDSKPFDDEVTADVAFQDSAPSPTDIGNKPVDDQVTAEVAFQDSAPSKTDIDSKPVDDGVTADVAFQDSAPSTTDTDNKPVDDEVAADVAFQDSAPSTTDVDSKPVDDEVAADVAFQGLAPSMTDIDNKPVDDEVTADMPFQDWAPSTTDVGSKPVDDGVIADVAFQDSAPSTTEVESKPVHDEVTADVAFQDAAPSTTEVDSLPVDDEVTADVAFQDSAPSTTDVDNKPVDDEVTADVAFQDLGPSTTDIDAGNSKKRADETESIKIGSMLTNSDQKDGTVQN